MASASSTASTASTATATATSPSSDVLGRTIGILGGGQLGRMICEDVRRMGMHVIVLDPTMDCPASHVANEHIHGDFRCDKEVALLATKTNLLTVEIEHVDVNALIAAEQNGVIVQPTPHTIRLIQDKYVQKKHLQSHSVPIAEFCDVDSVESIQHAALTFGYPLMLKSRLLAYDGRGNAVVKDSDSIKTAMESLVSTEKLYVEKWCPFIKELAVMVVRSLNGMVTSYPVVETIQVDNICSEVIAPARISPDVARTATSMAEKAIESLSGAGVFGVELFLMADGAVLLNEIAPRPHNSGHYTIEACYTSQFEQHIRAIAGLPLGDCGMKTGASIMVNVIGSPSGNLEETWAPCARAIATPGASVHWYGKSACKPKRKMGHITIVGTSMDMVMRRRAIILGEAPPPCAPLVGVIMGSDSDLPTMKPCAEMLRNFNVPFEVTIVSAHRTPDRMLEYAREAAGRGLKCIIAAAGGAAHLPGMTAALTPLPVIGVPIALKYLDGVDSLHSIVQMPRGVPVATVAISNSTNAALLAIRILGAFDSVYLAKMMEYQEDMNKTVLSKVDRLEEIGWENYTL